MDDTLKLSKDKHHRSSSSLTAVILEGTRSERKLEFRASIPEVDHQFALAEARCDDLQDKLDLVKGLKRKRKFKKRSMTRITEQVPVENLPLISIRAQPKRKVSQQAARVRQLELPRNPIRGYVDPATVEQHQMLGRVRGYSQKYKPMNLEPPKSKPSVDQMIHPRTKSRRAPAAGDSSFGHGVPLSNKGTSLEVACGEDEAVENFLDTETYDYSHNNLSISVNKRGVSRSQTKESPMYRRKPAPRNVPPKEFSQGVQEIAEREIRDLRPTGAPPRRRQPKNILHHNATVAAQSQAEERPVVELFNKNRPANSASKRHVPAADKHQRGYENSIQEDPIDPSVDEVVQELRKDSVHNKHPRRLKYRSHRYEQPTVASQMKQAGMRYYYGLSNHSNIPFVVSKSTAPSHNIGVNIQQVLNGLKIQQPLSGICIPATIAHHMGLDHLPHNDTKNAQPGQENREINAIRLGRKLVRLPSYKYMSYNRLLNLYREGEGIVPRFLRAISRPHYFYTSMYNLATREDFDGATSKGLAVNQEAKHSLSEYANMYREYVHLEKCIKDGEGDPQLERRREELTHELAAREDNIRRVMQEYRMGAETEQVPLRASASTAEEGYRKYSINLGDDQQ